MSRQNASKQVDAKLIDSLQELVEQYQKLVDYYELPFYKKLLADAIGVSSLLIIQMELGRKLGVYAALKSLRDQINK